VVSPASESEAVATAVFAAIARRDLPAIRALLHPDDEQDFVPVGLYRGADAVLGYFSTLFASFPDFTIEVEHIVSDDAGAWVRWRAQGTFTGVPYQGILATGRTVELRGVDARIEVRDGLIWRNTIFYDGGGFLRGIGLLPARGSRAEGALIAVFNVATRIRRIGRREPPR
jgi:ketosteroid isomerase-like protein